MISIYRYHIIMLNNYFIGIDESDNIISDYINSNSITGYGKLYCNSSSYNGMLKKSKMDGNGLIIYSGNTQILSYSGEFKDNLYNGSGTIKYLNGDTFIGQFRNGKKDGPGKLYNSNGIVIMETEWKDDIIWGKTDYIEYYPNSKNIKISGLYVNSIKIGPWIYCLENGIIERIDYYSKDEKQKIEKLERQLIMDKSGYLIKQIIQLDYKNNNKYDFEMLLMLGKYSYNNKIFNINNKMDYNKYYDIAIPVDKQNINFGTLFGHTHENSNGRIVIVSQMNGAIDKIRLTDSLNSDPNIGIDKNLKIYIKENNTVKIYYLPSPDKIKIYFEGTIDMSSHRILNGSLYSNNYCYTGDFNSSNQIISGTMHHVKIINDRHIIGKIYYRGSFKLGKPDIEGIYYDDNEHRQYEGQHINGKYNGHGILYRENGSIIWEGEWRNGKKHGRGRLYGDDGSLIAECIYDNDNYDRAI